MRRSCVTSPTRCRSASAVADELEHWSFQPIGRPAVPGSRASRSSAMQSMHFSWRSSKRRRCPSARRRIGGRLFAEPVLICSDCRRRRTKSRIRKRCPPDAYEKLIDRLLASPHYAERWGGTGWMWRLRRLRRLQRRGPRASDGVPLSDYVLRSFNADKPWDAFIVEQLAATSWSGPPTRNYRLPSWTS